MHLARAKALRADCAPENATLPFSPSLRARRLNFASSGPLPTIKRAAGKHRLMRGERLEQHIDALQISELADEHEIHRVVGQHRLVELVAVKPMRHDASGTARLADQLDITIGGKHAFE